MIILAKKYITCDRSLTLVSQKSFIIINYIFLINNLISFNKSALYQHTNLEGNLNKYHERILSRA